MDGDTTNLLTRIETASLEDLVNENVGLTVPKPTSPLTARS